MHVCAQMDLSTCVHHTHKHEYRCMYICVSDTVVCMLTHARGGSVHGGCLGDLRMTHIRSCWVEEYRHGLGRVCECPLRGGMQRRLWAHPWAYEHALSWGLSGVQWPSLPAGTALGQTLQNGLQVLLVGADLGKVTLKGLDL